MPLKAELCVEGNRLLYEFCAKHSVPHKKTGKLVVATNAREEEYLANVLAIARDNGVEIREIDGDEAMSMEPNVRATAALHVPSSGIIDAPSLVNALRRLARKNGVLYLDGTEVTGIKSEETVFKVGTKDACDTEETSDASIVINAAGLYADDVARMVNPTSPYEMEPIRGEAVSFSRNARPDIGMNGMNVYPAPYGIDKKGDRVDVPYAEFKELLAAKAISKSVGVHLTPTFGADGKVGDTVTIGPASVGPVDKEDYTGREADYVGKKPPSTPVKPLRESKYFVEGLVGVKRFFPNLTVDDVVIHDMGIRAKLKGVVDFVIEHDPRHPRCINVVGSDSPGLTSSLAIAKEVRRLVEEVL